MSGNQPGKILMVRDTHDGSISAFGIEFFRFFSGIRNVAMLKTRRMVDAYHILASSVTPKNAKKSTAVKTNIH